MIKGLTDNVVPAFPFLGKLRKGDEMQEKNGKKTVGKELKHWRFTSENPDIERAFHEAYGDQPVALRIYLPYRDVETNWSTWKEAWVSGGLQHRCDGEMCQIWRTDKGTYSRNPKPCPGGCKEVGRMVMWLPELIKAGYVGYVTMETHAKNDLAKITATLNAVAEQRQNDPAGLQGIEFTLRRVKQMISTPGPEGTRVRREKWMVSIEPVASWAQTYLAIAGSAQAAIAAPGMVDTETGEIFGDDDDDGDDILDGDYIEHKPVATVAAVPQVNKPVSPKQQPAPKQDIVLPTGRVFISADQRENSDHEPMGNILTPDDNDPDLTIDEHAEGAPWQAWKDAKSGIKTAAEDWAFSVGIKREHSRNLWTQIQTTGKINSKDMPKPFYDAVLERLADGKQDFTPTAAGTGGEDEPLF